MMLPTCLVSLTGYFHVDNAKITPRPFSIINCEGEREKLKATEIENLAKPDAKDEEKKSSGVTGMLFGGLVLVATLGAVNYFRNKD